MRRTTERTAPDVRPNLTPMIDIVFNLIIFFMIVAELSNLSVEVLALPTADMARPIEAKEKRIQLNLLADGRVKVQGKAYDKDALAEFLQGEAAVYPRNGKGWSLLEVNVRADGDAPYRHWAGVMDGCMSAEIFQTHVAANEEVPR